MTVFKTLVLAALLLGWVQSFNPRTTCFFNQLMSNSRFNNFKLLISRDATLSPLLKSINSIDISRQYARVVTSNISLTNQSLSLGLSWCRNIIIHQESCCLNSQFLSFTNSLNSAYNIFLNSTQYPIAKYASNLTPNLNKNNCSYNRTYGPDISPAFVAIINNYSALIKKIEINERNFINQTSCLVCMGTKDYANFIYPNVNSPQFPDLNNFMYQRTYFNSRVEELTGIMLQLEGLHSNMTTLIAKLGNTISSSQPACVALKTQSTNLTFLQGMKICSDNKSCRKNVVKYFGQLLAPQLLLFINRMSNSQPMMVVKGPYVISNNANFGFKGNVSYQPMFGYRYLPNVTTYNDSNEYSGLY